MLHKKVIDTCLAMNQCGLNTGKSGNVSARNEEGFLITASGVAYEVMTPSDVVQMDLEGGYFGEAMPSSEWRMHMDIYRARPEAKAIVHTHAPYAAALSCLRKEIPPFHYMIALTGGPTLRCSAYASFGTEALSDAMLDAIEGRNACLLANHGMICFSDTLERALALAVEIETLCKQYTLACQVGDPAILDDAEMQDVILRFKTYGKPAHALDAGEALAFLPPEKRDG